MSRRQFARPTRDRRRAARRHRLHGAARRHGRLLRVGVPHLARPDLRGTPVIIGGRAGAASCSRPPTRPARFGVTSAMPMARARRLCPQAVVLAARPRRYSAISAAVMETFPRSPRSSSRSRSTRPSSTSPARCAGSGRPTAIGEQLRDTIADEQGITCSVGIAPTKFVAKLASSLAKPDGLVVVPRDEVVPFLHQLPVGALWGVGERTEEHLQRLGPAHRRPTSRTPRSSTLVRASATPPATTCTSWPGGATRGRSCASSARRASAATRPSPRHRRRRRDPPRLLRARRAHRGPDAGGRA